MLPDFLRRCVSNYLPHSYYTTFVYYIIVTEHKKYVFKNLFVECKGFPITNVPPSPAKSWRLSICESFFRVIWISHMFCLHIAYVLLAYPICSACISHMFCLHIAYVLLVYRICSACISHTVNDRISARGAYLKISSVRGALIRQGRLFKKGRLLNFLKFSA